MAIFVTLTSDRIRGLMFVAFGYVLLLGFYYIALVQRDRYYCLLVPLSLPILVVAIYFHWLSMKLFKHAQGSN